MQVKALRMGLFARPGIECGGSKIAFRTDGERLELGSGDAGQDFDVGCGGQLNAVDRAVIAAVYAQCNGHSLSLILGQVVLEYGVSVGVDDIPDLALSDGDQLIYSALCIDHLKPEVRIDFLLAHKDTRADLDQVVFLSDVQLAVKIG